MMVKVRKTLCQCRRLWIQRNHKKISYNHKKIRRYHKKSLTTVECAQVDQIKYDSVFCGMIAPSQSPQSKIWRNFIIATFRGYGVKVPLFFWFEAVWGRKPQVINLRGLEKRLVRSDWNLKGRLLTYEIEEIWCLVRVKMPPIKKMVRLRDIKNDCRNI